MTRAHRTDVTDVHFDSSLDTSVFGFIYLMKKYRSRCFIPGKLQFTSKDGGKLKYVIERTIYKKPRVLGPDLAACVQNGEPVIFIPLEIHFVSPDGVHMQAMVHQNLLIYRPQKGVVERFEPDFNEYASYATINDRLKTLFEETLVPVLGPVRYTFEHPACPVLKKSVQELEASASAKPREEGIGYCQMWSLFVMEAVLMNPDLDMAAIVEECFRVSNSRPEYLRQMMRGYVQNFSNEMEEIMQLNLKKKGLHPFLITRSDRAKIYNEAFETVAYHTRKHRHPESSSKSSSLSASSAHSEITPDLKHTPLRDLEGLLQVTRGNYDYDKGFRPTRTRRDYARKLKQYLRLQKWPLRKLWDVAAIVWEQARVKMFEKRDEWDKKTEGFIPQLKYAAISTLSKLHAYTQGNYDFNISPNKRVPEMHDAIKQYMQEHDVTVDELWEAAEAEWGKTPALEPLSFN